MKNHIKSVFYDAKKWGSKRLGNIKSIEKAISFEINGLWTTFSMFSMFYMGIYMIAEAIV